MKELEVFVPGLLLIGIGFQAPWVQGLTIVWVLIIVLIPMFNKRRQRLGDMIAGTFVIQRPLAVLLPDITVEGSKKRAAGRERYAFPANQLDHYGRYELQTLERVLQASGYRSKEATGRRLKNLTAIAGKVRAKIGYGELIEDQDAEEFLTAFYAAQRTYLEQRQLFGEAREDKFHRSAPVDDDTRGE